MNSLILAALLPLNPGYNNPGVAGEVVAIEAATSNATAIVAIKSVQSFTTYTNATAEVVSYEPAWAVTIITNGVFDTKTVLPDEFFPIVVQYDADPVQTLRSMDDVTISPTGWAETLYQLDTIPANPIGPVCYFKLGSSPEGHFATYDSYDAFISVLTFNGEDPQPSDGIPYLEYETPLTAVTNVVGYLDYSAFVDTNGVSTIVGDPVRFDMAITNTVVTGQAISGYYAATNDIGSVTTSGHFGSVSTNAFILGDALLVTGAADGDSIKVLIK